MKGRKVLLVNDNGSFQAIGALCSHYSGKLENGLCRSGEIVAGVYSKGAIRCPLHGACFSTKTGDIEDFPGLDALFSFQVSLLCPSGLRSRCAVRTCFCTPRRRDSS